MAKIQITPLKILLKFREFKDWGNVIRNNTIRNLNSGNTNG